MKEKHLHDAWLNNFSKLNITWVKENHLYEVILDFFGKSDQVE